MTRKFSFAPDEFYHIYNRGNDKKFIFPEEIDKKRFQFLLYVCNSTKSVDLRELSYNRTFDVEREDTLVDLGAYCLLFNHFHLLLHEKIEKGISCFMQKLATAYAMYFNVKYNHVGTIFESKFKARHADSDEYLRYLFAYIHLNPVEHIDPEWKEKGITDITKAQGYIKKYNYSSYVDYLEVERPEKSILNKSAFPAYFDSVDGIEAYHSDWLQHET